MESKENIFSLSYFFFFIIFCIMTTISYKDTNMDDITLTKPEKIENCYICNLYHNDDLLYIQTPYCKINEIVEENGEKFIDVEIDNKGFIDFLLEIDENNVKNTFNNSNEWFGKDIPYEAIENMYEEQEIFETDNNKFSMKFKIPQIDGKIQCNIYNENKELIDIENLNDKLNLVLILHIKGLRILKESFNLEYYINQIKIINIDEFNILKEYSIIDDNISENIDETIFSEEINSVLEGEKLEERQIEEKKLEELEKEKLKELEKELKKLKELEKEKQQKKDIENQINKLKEELNKLNI